MIKRRDRRTNHSRILWLRKYHLVSQSLHIWIKSQLVEQNAGRENKNKQSIQTNYMRMLKQLDDRDFSWKTKTHVKCCTIHTEVKTGNEKKDSNNAQRRTLQSVTIQNLDSDTFACLFMITKLYFGKRTNAKSFANFIRANVLSAHIPATWSFFCFLLLCVTFSIPSPAPGGLRIICIQPLDEVDAKIKHMKAKLRDLKNTRKMIAASIAAAQAAADEQARVPCLLCVVIILLDLQENMLTRFPVDSCSVQHHCAFRLVVLCTIMFLCPLCACFSQNFFMIWSLFLFNGRCRAFTVLFRISGDSSSR